MIIHGKEYTEVKDRIALFYKDYPDGHIQTEIVWHNEDFSRVCVKAVVYKNLTSLPTNGLAYEERTQASREVNYTSWVENCETSAIGRALANMNIGVTTARPSVEEMKKVERMSASADIMDDVLSKEYEILNQSLDTEVFNSQKDVDEWIKKNKDKINELSEAQKNKLRNKVILFKKRWLNV